MRGVSPLRAVVAVSAVLATPAFAQQTPVFNVGLDMVYVTVTVRDARGGLVSDLQPEDFVVREDGRVQKVQIFGAAAGQVHAGEHAPRTALLHCTRCGETRHVNEGDVVEPCPQGHRTFDIGDREELSLNLGMLFDTSESMRKDLRLSQESAIRFLDAIPRARDLLLVFFDRDIRLSRYSSDPLR